MKHISKIAMLLAVSAGAYAQAAGDDVSANAAASAAPTPAPTGAEDPTHVAIKAKFNNMVDVVDTKFHFKKKTDETSGVESKRPTLELKLPRPSIEGLAEILMGGDEKQQALLLEAVANIVLDRARELINDDTGETLNQDNFPMEELSWAKIANQPAAERRGGGIAKETWDEFAKDYEAVMPGVTGKPIENIKRATKVYLTKFNMVKTDKKVLALLKGQLALYLNATPNAEVFMDCVTFLDKKAETLINAESSSLLDAL
jgi:hypothetical protein